MQLNIKKTKQLNQKMGRRPNQTLLQGQYTDDHQTHEKMLNLAHYYRNENPYYKEVSAHTSHNGHHPKIYKKIIAGEDVAKREPFFTVGGNVN